MFYCVMYRSASVSPLKTEVNHLREGKQMFNFSSLVYFEMRHKYFYCDSLIQAIILFFVQGVFHNLSIW